jgi:hypothetical protein
MDSTWFAVDADGEVAIFDTGEGGCIPEGGFPMGGEAGGSAAHALADYELLAYALAARARSDERLRALLPDDPEVLADVIAHGDVWEVVQSLLRGAGVWTYACTEAAATPFLRQGSVLQPLRIDDLADEMRRRFAEARLPMRFREAPAVAPGEHVPVHAWGNLWFDLQGRPHPTAEGSERDVEGVPADFVEWAKEQHFEAMPGETLEGEPFYETVAKLVAAGTARLPRSRRPPSAEGGEGGSGGVLGWLGRLLGGR